MVPPVPSGKPGAKKTGKPDAKKTGKPDAKKKKDYGPPASIPKTSPPDANDPSIRYLYAGYGDEGTCPICMGDGVVGRFCFKCCDEAGMMVGRCPRCDEVGRLGDDCPECITTSFETALEEGVCSTCGGGGAKYTECQICEDQSSHFE
jgi:hypothetical protein